MPATISAEEASVIDSPVTQEPLPTITPTTGAQDDGSIAGLEDNPDFLLMPVDRRIAEINKRLPKDHRFASQNKDIRHAVIKHLLDLQPPEVAMQQAIGEIASLQPRGAQAIQASRSTAIVPSTESMPQDIAYGAATGAVRGVEAPLHLLKAGVQLVDPVLSKVFGVPPMGEIPPATGTILEKGMAGPEGFAAPQSTAGRFVQNSIQNLAAIATIGGPWRTIVQGVVAGMLGQTVDELQRGPDGTSMNPWLRMGIELVGQVGVGRVQDTLTKARQLNELGVPIVQAFREAATGPSKIYQSFRETLGHPAEQKSLEQAINVQQRYPGTQIGVEGAASPSLLTVAETKLTEPQRIALLQRREQNQAIIQKQLEATTGAGQVEGATEVFPLLEQKAIAAVEPSTQALMAAEATQAAVPIGPEAQALTAAEQARQVAGIPLMTARQEQLAARRAAVASKERQVATEAQIAQTELQNTQDLGLAQQKVKREMESLAAGRQAGETTVDFFTRIGTPIRQAYEKIKNRWQNRARELYEDIDPKNIIATTGGDILPILDDIESQATTAFQGKYAPRTTQAIRRALAERAERGGPSRVTLDQEAAGQGNVIGDIWDVSRQTDLEAIAIAAQDATKLANVKVSLNDLRRIRSEALKEARATTDSTARYYLNQLDDSISNLMDKIAPPELMDEVKTINRWYRREGLRFWEGPGARILAKTPQGTDRLSNAQVISEWWGGGVTPGAAPRAVARPEALRTVIGHIGNEAEAMQAIKTFAEADLYTTVVKDGMSLARDGIDAVDTTKLAQWLRRHNSLVQELPKDMQEPFSNVRSAYQALRDQERRGEVLLSQARAPLAEIKTEAEAASLARAEATVRVQEAQVPFTAATQTVREAQKALTTAESTAEDAVALAARAHKDAAEAFAHSAVGRLTKDEHLQENFATMMNEKIPVRNRYLNELYETVKDDPQARQGLLRMIWQDFEAKQQVGKHITEATRLADAVPLLDHRQVKAFLKENERWLKDHYPNQFDNLTTITNDLAVAQRHMTTTRGPLPTAIKPASAVERSIVDLGTTGVVIGGIEAVRSLGAGFIPPYISYLAGAAAGGVANHWLTMRTDQRLRLLQEALVNEDASRILARMRDTATRPEWFRTSLYNFLLRQGMVGGSSNDQ